MDSRRGLAGSCARVAAASCTREQGAGMMSACADWIWRARRGGRVQKAGRCGSGAWSSSSCSCSRRRCEEALGCTARAGHGCGSLGRRRGAGERLRARQVRHGEAACGQKRERKGRRGAEVRLRARQVLLLSWCCLLLEVKKREELSCWCRRGGEVVRGEKETEEERPRRKRRRRLTLLLLLLWLHL